MTTTLRKTNVVIVGLGAAGGVACLPLAQAGLEVVGLVAGPRLSTRDMAPDELRLNRNAWPPGPQKAENEGPTARPNTSTVAVQGGLGMVNAVGGTSVHYWGQSWRLHPWDFKVRSETIRRYGASRLPKGSTVEDWPFAYHELEPYYDKVEQAIGVSGKAGNIDGKIDVRGNMWVHTERRPIAAVNALGIWLQGKPTWGSAWKAFVRNNADRMDTAFIQKTTLHYEDNHLDLDPDVKDPFGLPVVRITGEFKDNERRIALFMHEKMEQWYRAAGAIAVQRVPIANAMGSTTHAYGGARMGDNPETSVINGWGFSHEAPNLGILGGAVMGTSGSRNPTLTLQAIAWRTAEYLARNWKSIAT